MRILPIIVLMAFFIGCVGQETEQTVKTDEILQTSTSLRETTVTTSSTTSSAESTTTSSTTTIPTTITKEPLIIPEYVELPMYDLDKCRFSRIGQINHFFVNVSEEVLKGNWAVVEDGKMLYSCDGGPKTAVDTLYFKSIGTIEPKHDIAGQYRLGVRCGRNRPVEDLLDCADLRIYLETQGLNITSYRGEKTTIWRPAQSTTTTTIELDLQPVTFIADKKDIVAGGLFNFTYFGFDSYLIKEGDVVLAYRSRCDGKSGVSRTDGDALKCEWGAQSKDPETGEDIAGLENGPVSRIVIIEQDGRIYTTR